MAEQVTEKQWKSATTGGSLPKFIRPSALSKKDVGVLIEATFTSLIPSRFDEGKFDYKFEDEDGNAIIINNAAHLAYQMKAIPVGTYCKIHYLGKEAYKNKKTGKSVQAHQFKVEYI